MENKELELELLVEWMMNQFGTSSSVLSIYWYNYSPEIWNFGNIMVLEMRSKVIFGHPKRPPVPFCDKKFKTKNRSCYNLSGVPLKTDWTTVHLKCLDSIRYPLNEYKTSTKILNCFIYFAQSSILNDNILTDSVAPQLLSLRGLLAEKKTFWYDNVDCTVHPKSNISFQD